MKSSCVLASTLFVALAACFPAPVPTGTPQKTLIPLPPMTGLIKREHITTTSTIHMTPIPKRNGADITFADEKRVISTAPGAKRAETSCTHSGIHFNREKRDFEPLITASINFAKRTAPPTTITTPAYNTHLPPGFTNYMIAKRAEPSCTHREKRDDVASAVLPTGMRDDLMSGGGKPARSPLKQRAEERDHHAERAPEQDNSYNPPLPERDSQDADHKFGEEKPAIMPLKQRTEDISGLLPMEIRAKKRDHPAGRAPEQ